MHFSRVVVDYSGVGGWGCTRGGRGHRGIGGISNTTSHHRAHPTCCPVSPWPADEEHLSKLGTAVLLGLASSAVGIVALLLMGLFRQVGQRLHAHARSEGIAWMATLLLPMVAGAAVGLVGKAYPLTYGDGSFQLSYVTKSIIAAARSGADDVGHVPSIFDDDADDDTAFETYALMHFLACGSLPTAACSLLVQPQAVCLSFTSHFLPCTFRAPVPLRYAPAYLAKTVALDLLLLAVCQGFGFVGGQIFPALFAGYLSGLIAYLK